MAIVGMGRPDFVAEVSMAAPQRGICRVCAGPILEGQEVLLDRATLTFRHIRCVDQRASRREVPARSSSDRSAEV